MPECSDQAFVTELTTNQPGREFEMLIRTASPLHEQCASTDNGENLFDQHASPQYHSMG
jgi:hypothetical protein